MDDFSGSSIDTGQQISTEFINSTSVDNVDQTIKPSLDDNVATCSDQQHEHHKNEECDTSSTVQPIFTPTTTTVNDPSVLINQPHHQTYPVKPPLLERTKEIKKEKERGSVPPPVLESYGVEALMMKEANPNMDDNEIIEKIRLWQKETKEYLESNQNTINEEIEHMLMCETYFNTNEIRVLFNEFIKCSGGSAYMTKDQFSQEFSPFLESSKLTDSLLMAIDENGDGQIAFTEFVLALSIMTRGTKMEKLRFCFMICDFNRDNFVSRDEVFQVVSTIKELFSAYLFTKDRFGSPHEVVSSIFSGGISSSGSKFLQEKNELDINDFIERGELETDLSGCFGMFDYFYYKFVLPCDELFSNDIFNVDGTVIKVKDLKLFNSKHKRRLKIKQAFLIVYDINLKGQEKKPSRVIFLPGATVRVLLDPKISEERKKHHHLHKFGRRKNISGFYLVSGEYARAFYTQTPEEAVQWVNAIRHYSRLGYKFQSFAQQRMNNQCLWFVNAVNYYRDLANEIMQARFEIFLAGWWVWPYVILQRDNKELMEKTRLDRLLTTKAKQGVRIYVLMWDESNIGIQLGTNHSTRWLENCHPNISVIRHPKRYPLSWSHHQKTVVIDQSVAYIGGIDICFMRYELDTFPLVDLDSKLFPGKDYGNLTSIVTRTGNPHRDQLDRNEIPRMPWHDVNSKIIGPSVHDAATNFIQRWNHAITVGAANTRRKPYLIPRSWWKKDEEKKLDHLGRFSGKKNPFKNIYSDIVRNVGNISYGEEKRTRYHRVGDDPKARKDALQGAAKHSTPFNNNIEDDQAFKNQLKEEVEKQDAHQDPLNIPSVDSKMEKAEQELDDEEQNLSNLMTTIAPCNGASTNTILDYEEKENYHNIYNLDEPHGNCINQVVRSSCQWSAGSDTEDSCYKAYLGIIKTAKHFIYIQNLFFISSCGAKLPKNRIAMAILQKLRHAIKSKQNFKVIVLTNLNPAGDIKETSSRIVIGWTLQTICRGGQSIIELLQKEFPDVDISQYFGVYSLRNYELCYDRVFSEQIYIHSKVIIADDRIAMIGSCNINDRSMLGARDSEIATVILDRNMKDGIMDGEVVKVREFAHSLRMHLWKLHLGINQNTDPQELNEIRDPVRSFNSLWSQRAKLNSATYKEAFGSGIPENQTILPASLSHPRYFNRTDQMMETLSKIKGFLIEYPYNMYQDSDLFDIQGILTPEHFVNTSIFI